MLLRSHPRITNQARDAVSQNLRQWSGIFVCNYFCNGPGGGSVLGRKGRSILKKTPVAGSLTRTLAPERILRRLSNHQAVECSLAGEESGFPPMRVMVLVA